MASCCPSAARQGHPNDFVLEDYREADLAPWPRLAANAAVTNLYAIMEGARGLFLAKISPGAGTE